MARGSQVRRFAPKPLQPAKPSHPAPLGAIDRKDLARRRRLWFESNAVHGAMSSSVCPRSASGGNVDGPEPTPVRTTWLHDQGQIATRVVYVERGRVEMWASTLT